MEILLNLKPTNKIDYLKTYNGLTALLDLWFSLVLHSRLVGFKFKMLLVCRKFFTLSSDVTECSFGAQVGADKCVIHYCMQVVSGIEKNFELTKYFGLME